MASRWLWIGDVPLTIEGSPIMANLPMNVRRGGRTILLIAIMVCGTAAAGILGPGGVAHAAGTDTYFVAGSCTNVAASVTYAPGLRKAKAKAGHAALNGIISDCSDELGPFGGTGSISAVLSGKASFDAENFTGTFSVAWPASSGLVASDGTLTVTDTDGTETVSGTVTSGAFPGGLLALELTTTAHSGTGTKKSPVTSQLFANT